MMQKATKEDLLNFLEEQNSFVNENVIYMQGLDIEFYFEEGFEEDEPNIFIMRTGIRKITGEIIAKEQLVAHKPEFDNDKKEQIYAALINRWKKKICQFAVLHMMQMSAQQQIFFPIKPEPKPLQSPDNML